MIVALALLGFSILIGAGVGLWFSAQQKIPDHFCHACASGLTDEYFFLPPDRRFCCESCVPAVYRRYSHKIDGRIKRALKEAK